jgi:hypothetical protein
MPGASLLPRSFLVLPLNSQQPGLPFKAGRFVDAIPSNIPLIKRDFAAGIVFEVIP